MMSTLLKPVVQALTLVVIGGAAGVAANGIRQDKLTVTRDYFPAHDAGPRPGGTVNPGDKANKGVLPVHNLQTVTLDEVVAAFNDPDHKPGESDSKIFFIDARDDVNFNEGHIPGALQVDHYRVEKYMPDVLPMLEEAKKIIVYCNGGDCEDSIHVCHDLMDAKVPYEKLYLFEGGMKAWKDAKQAVE